MASESSNAENRLIATLPQYLGSIFFFFFLGVLAPQVVKHFMPPPLHHQVVGCNESGIGYTNSEDPSVLHMMTWEEFAKLASAAPIDNVADHIKALQDDCTARATTR